jgi:hypothetical protein
MIGRAGFLVFGSGLVILAGTACGTSAGNASGAAGSSGAGGSGGATSSAGGSGGLADGGPRGGTGGSSGASGSSAGSGGGAAGAGGAGPDGGTMEGGIPDAGRAIDGGNADGAPDSLDASSRDASGTSMSFFVSSTASAMGGNLGGLVGADARCQALATAVGAGNRTWHAYLSASGPTPLNARDRIGIGPWYNVRGIKMADNLAQLHDEGGMMNALSFLNTLDERGNTVRFANPDEHDVMTGSGVDGRVLPGPDRTCAGWTLSSGGSVQVGHTDRMGGGERPTSWNSAHAVPGVPPLSAGGCALTDLQAAGGIGRIYCFAID